MKLFSLKLLFRKGPLPRIWIPKKRQVSHSNNQKSHSAEPSLNQRRVSKKKPKIERAGTIHFLTASVLLLFILICAEPASTSHSTLPVEQRVVFMLSLQSDRDLPFRLGLLFEYDLSSEWHPLGLLLSRPLLAPSGWDKLRKAGNLIGLRIENMTEEAMRTMTEAGIEIKTRAQVEMEQGRQEGETSTWIPLQCYNTHGRYLQMITDRDGNMVLNHHLVEVASMDQTSPKLLMLELMMRYLV